LDKKGAHHEGIIPQRNEKSSSVFQEHGANFQTITSTMNLSNWLKNKRKVTVDNYTFKKYF
jgi:hypothetical protein